MRVAHLGPRGTYTEVAALSWQPDATLLAVPSVGAAVEAVLAGEADAAVCAMEDSIEGTASIETLVRALGASRDDHPPRDIVAATRQGPRHRPPIHGPAGRSPSANGFDKKHRPRRSAATPTA